jgi:transposase
MDPCAVYRSAVQAALPNATIVADRFHVVRLANETVTKVRQRTTREQLDRRGRKADPVWANRRLLPQGQEHLSVKAFARMWNGCVDHEPTGDLLAAWIAKEELPALMATAARGGNRSDISHHTYRFFAWCADRDIPEVTTLAETIQAWWPQILGFLELNIINAGTEGTNKLIKDASRVAFGFRNLDNQRRRVRFACTHRQRLAATG